jgi:hypothetical protein
MPLRRRLADLCLTSKAYSKAGGSLLRSTSGASADGRQIGLMIERLNMLGATPESFSEAAKPTDDPTAASPSAPRLIATARAPLDLAVSKTSNPAQS